MSAEKHVLTVCGFVRDDGACGKYRVAQPLTKCEEHGLFKANLIWPGANHDTILNKLSGAHVVVIPRVFDEDMLALMDRLKKLDVKVVVEHDDNMFDISPWSVHYAEFGTENIQVNHEGKLKDLWKDGLNIDLKTNRARLDGFRRAIEKADMVQVTQPILANVYKRFNDNVICLPNCVDGKVWQKLPLKERDDIRIMWSGGSSHYQDVFILKEVLPKICKQYPEVKIVQMGCQWPALMREVPVEQYEFHDWVSIEAYPYKHAALDIDLALIPLEDNRFNRCKSNIKLVEQAFLGVPAVASYVSPYKEFYAGNNMVLVNNDDASWYEGISLMIEDAELRKKTGKHAENYAREHFDADSKSHLWAEAYARLANS